MRETKVVPDFVVVEGFQPRLIVETKIAYLSTNIPKRMESLAFRVGKLKKEIESLKALLILGGWTGRTGREPASSALWRVEKSQYGYGYY